MLNCFEEGGTIDPTSSSIAERSGPELSGPELPDAQTDLHHLLTWWQQYCQHDEIAHNTTRQIDIARETVSRLLFLFGLLSGTFLTGAVITYTGEHPVNLLVLFATLILLPAVLAIIGLSVGLSARFRPLPAGLSLFHRSLTAWLNRTGNLRLMNMMGRRRRYQRLGYWLGQSLAQTYALGFYISAFVTMILVVSFSDLAFGWSTTLQIETDTIHQATTLLSLPWQFFSAGVPSIELVDASRYYRLDIASTRDAQLLGAWWPFVTLTLVVWGLLPRLLLWIVSAQRLNSLTEKLLLTHPSAVEMLQQLNQPPSPSQSASDNPMFTEHKTSPSVINQWPTNSAHIIWNGATEMTGATLVTNSMVAKDLTAELESANLMAREALVVHTKGWEPPVLELLDLIAELRHIAGSEPTIIVNPIQLDDASSDNDLTIWRAVTARLGDNKLFVKAPGAEIS